MNWRKQLMLAAVLIIALSMAAGAYHTEAATPVNSQAIVLTQKTSVGGKLFFVIDVQKLRQTYPQAVAVNVFMDIDPGAAITQTSVPLIYDNGTYNGMTAPYQEYLKLDTSGIGENLLIVSLELPSNNAWWAAVAQKTGVNYANTTSVYLKIQIDKNTVAVMDGHFSVTNNTLIGTYSISDTKFSYTGFNATWYGGPATVNGTTGSIQLKHGDGTPFNLTNGDASWVKYQVYVSNGHEDKLLFNITETPAGPTNTNTSDIFGFADITYHNESTSQVKFALIQLTDFSVTPTGTEEKGGVTFAYSEFEQLLYNVEVSPISDDKYPNSFNNGTTDTVKINLTSTSYLQLTLEDTNSVFAMGEIGLDGVKGTLTYYTYNSSANEFQKPHAHNYTVDYVFNQTSDKAYEVYTIIWNQAPAIEVYPSIELNYNDTTLVGSLPTSILGSQLNPGDEFVVTGHNLPADANFSAVCLAYWDAESGAFKVWKADLVSLPVGSKVLPDGTLMADAIIPAHWYGGKMFYPILRVNVTGTLYRTWVTESSGMKIFPYTKAYYLGNDGDFHSANNAKLAPGDYILIKGYGFITTEDLTPFVSYDLTNLTTALKSMITLSDIQGLDTDGDGMVDVLFVKNDTTGDISLVVRLPADVNTTKLSSGFRFGLKGTGDNVGLSLDKATSAVYDGSAYKIFVWPYGDDVARFFANTTSLEVKSNYKDVMVYPYEAYEYINGLSESDVKFAVEIIGYPEYNNATLDVNLNGPVFYKLASLNATSDLVQGYKELVFKTPTLPFGVYPVFVNESNSSTYTFHRTSNYGVNITCIVGYKLSGSESYEMLTGTITAKPGANITFIGFGFEAGKPTKVYSYVPYLGTHLAMTETDDYGSFNVTMSTKYLLQLTGRDSGVFQMKLYTYPSGCKQMFTLVISEKPLFEISVKTDPNAFVGDTIYVSVKLLLKYKTDVLPMLSQPSDLAKLEYIELWFIYSPNDVKQVKITDLNSAPVVYVNPETSEVVIAYVIDHQPENGNLVVDALAKASIFGGYFESTATDHAVVSVDTTLANMVNKAATAAGEAKTAAENAANAAQQAANAANDAKTAASNAATAAQKAASAAQSAASAASAAQKSANSAAQKITSVGDSLSKQIKDVSSKIDTANSAAGSAKTYSLVNTILIIITLLVAIYLVAKMKP
ncbi:MAG: hypothetical protein GSR82_02450 [Desulfurococcales archaeon]|nr:hypothetical protein [Desulfurococcales archaeon]